MAQAPRSAAPPTAGPDALLLHRCPPFEAWISVTACTMLRSRGTPEAPRYPAAGRKVPSVCTACVGVVELHRRGLTPAPRRVGT
jgi:hypothetical protein